jgi:hypothetical protein
MLHEVNELDALGNAGAVRAVRVPLDRQESLW